MDPTLVMLSILNNKDEEPRCARMRCEGVATFGEFRALLEKKPGLIPWPFDFYDAEMKCRIAFEFEHITNLESYHNKVNVIRSDDRQGMGMTRKRVDEESMALLEPTTVKEGTPPDSTVYIAPMACDPISATPCEELNEHEETSCPKLDPKHKVFLSHSGVEKSFVGKLCKLLEEHNHFPFFDQRPDSLPKGKKFAGLIIEAAKTCRVAVAVLSPDYLSSKWPMIELAEFVCAKKSRNKNLNLLPLFYKVSPHDLDDASIKDKWMPKWIELVGADPRVNPEKWAEAVRELRRANGIEFCKFEENKESYREKEEVYRDAIVEAIFKLAPPDLLHDMSEIHGGDRICKILANKFKRHPETSASVLGLYGMGGLGKTTISKNLCNHFTQEFLGRVCYIEMKEEVDALVRQQEVMRKLLRLVEPIMQNICYASQGWDILNTRMKENPVLLIIDNIQPDVDEEAFKYLDFEYHSLSKIVVVSRSLDVVEKLLGDRSCCCEIPRLKRDEAVGILLQQGGRNLEDLSHKKEELNIVEGFLEEACFRVYDVTQTTSLHEDGGRQYHPLALKALGAYLKERTETYEVLAWATYLDEYKELKDSGECYDIVFKILGLQFRRMDKVKQLMYLDIVLYGRYALTTSLLSNFELEDMEKWLANIYNVEASVVKRKIAYFKKLGMLNIERKKIIIHDLYKEYAAWAMKHVLNSGELVGVWHNGLIMNLLEEYSRIPEELQSSPSGSCWQELRRIHVQSCSFHGFGVTRFHEWQNVVVLQLISCDHVSTLNLQGFTCIRYLELWDLEKLHTLILTGDESTSDDTVFQASCVEPKLCSPRPWLRYVILRWLTALKHLPSFSPFTSLKYLEVSHCESLREPPRVQHCVHLRRMHLDWCPRQKTFPNLDGLTSLQDLSLHGYSVQPGCEALKLEGLSSLISLESLEMISIPVGDVNGLEKLSNVEFISVRGLYLLEDLPPLERLVRSSLNFLDVWVSDELKKRLEWLQWLIRHNFERLRAQGKPVPYFPSKIENFRGRGHSFLEHQQPTPSITSRQRRLTRGSMNSGRGVAGELSNRLGAWGPGLDLSCPRGDKVVVARFPHLDSSAEAASDTA